VCSFAPVCSKACNPSWEDLKGRVRTWWRTEVACFNKKVNFDYLSRRRRSVSITWLIKHTNIASHHAFTRRHAHEISCFYVTFSSPSSRVLEPDDHGTYLTVVYVLFETNLVNYIVSDSFQPTTHKAHI
jgi:hypothetical protein